MQSRCASSARRTTSWLPASSAATTFESSICVLILGVPLARAGHALSIRASVDRRHRLLHRHAHVLGGLGSAVAHRPLDDSGQLLVGELGRQVGADQLRLGLLATGQILAPGLAVGPGSLEPALALAAQHGQLVVGAFLGGLLQLGQHEPQRADTRLFRPRASLPAGRP